MLTNSLTKYIHLYLSVLINSFSEVPGKHIHCWSWRGLFVTAILFKWLIMSCCPVEGVFFHCLFGRYSNSIRPHQLSTQSDIRHAWSIVKCFGKGVSFTSCMALSTNGWSAKGRRGKENNVPLKQHMGFEPGTFWSTAEYFKHLAIHFSCLQELKVIYGSQWFQQFHSK